MAEIPKGAELWVINRAGVKARAMGDWSRGQQAWERQAEWRVGPLSRTSRTSLTAGQTHCPPPDPTLQCRWLIPEPDFSLA